LVNTIKAKFKMSGRSQVFAKYGKNIQCFDYKGEIICFVKWEDVKQINKNFLTNLPSKNPNDSLNITWISTQNNKFIFDSCAIKSCLNTDITLYHVHSLKRSFTGNSIIVKGRSMNLKGWNVISAAQKAKQLPFCSEHYKFLQKGLISKQQIDDFYIKFK
jgi:hypothetical protein